MWKCNSNHLLSYYWLIRVWIFVWICDCLFNRKLEELLSPIWTDQGMYGYEGPSDKAIQVLYYYSYIYLDILYYSILYLDIYITELQYGIHSMIHLFEQNDHWFYGHWTCKSFVVYWNFRGFGFVTFVDADSVEKVLDASPHHLDSKQVTNWFGQISILQQIWTEFQLGNLLYSVKVEIHLVQICHSWLPAVGVVHVWKLVCGSAKDKAGR